MFIAGVHYGLPYPFHEFETGRNLRLSPIYPTLRDNGAVFGQVMGYERPTWFETIGQYTQLCELTFFGLWKLGMNVKIA